jgi:site-specific recombinase XerD
VKDHGRSDAKRLSNALRALLRFQILRGHSQVGLDAIIPTVPQWKLSSLPRYLEPDVVERVIAACDRSTPNGLRDYAIILLLARLGFRAGDVMEMKISDVNWSCGTIVVRGKQRRESRLPLPQDVGDALLAYLKKGRPRVSLESMFLCMQAPFRPFVTSTPVASVVRKALKRAGVKNAPWQGAHLLRHSAATAMVRSGCTLETVAMVLRHKSMDTAAHYAKVDIGMLETVVQPWPAGASC